MMEVDSSSALEWLRLAPRDRILQRLAHCGVPEESLMNFQPGVVDFVKNNKDRLSDVLYAILPSDGELDQGGESGIPSVRDQLLEIILWVQWLMFEDEPAASLKKLAKRSVGQRGVCGAVWRPNDIAYHCRTCENDPTCAICVPCFQNGNHEGHDYALMYTGGGCCDCGDATAWKREGFCSKHKGAEQILPLPEEIANSVGPVLDVLFGYWKRELVLRQTALSGNSRRSDRDDESTKVVNEITSVIVEMLLEYCQHSESLLSFVSRKAFSSNGLLDVLVRAELFLSKSVMKKLLDLLLKLLGEPTFKYEFAKVFIEYYPCTVRNAIKEFSDSVLEQCPILSSFSVQIFTVPTLTPRLVREMNLIGVLLGCLGDIFSACAGEEHQLQVSRWASLYEITIRLIEDIRYVMSHPEVPKYITHVQPDISRTWLQLLTYVQGMNPQKRVTGLHVEEENENLHTPFVLGHSIANIHSLLVAGVFSSEERKGDLDDGDSERQAKVGRLSQESSVCGTSGSSSAFDGLQVAETKLDSRSHLPIPSSVAWLACECLRAIENWLGLNVESSDIKFSSQDSSRMGNGFMVLKKTLSKIRKGKAISKVQRVPSVRSSGGPSSEFHGALGPSPILSEVRINSNLDDDQDKLLVHGNWGDAMDVDGQKASPSGNSVARILEKNYCIEYEPLSVLNLSDWPDIIYDVSSQDISIHIPLHRLLSMLLQKALNICFTSGVLELTCQNSVVLSSGHFHDFFGHVLGGFNPYGFSGYLMENPLQIRVFCAQVRAGMWRKNGDAALLSSELYLYRSIRWSEQGMDLDLFLLQCCAALAPPDLYVKRILERFGLSNYLSLNIEQTNEYEAVLMQEMLTCIIQIVKERRFCGLSVSESLRRELIHKLAIGDATHSQLVKFLPPDLSKSDQLQKTLDAIAVYSHPSGLKQGRYSLRQECWKELDLYHPRWNSRDLQVAEDRYFRFCKVPALNAQLPQWTKVFYPLNGISRIATSLAVLQIVRAVLYYAVFADKSSSRAPDGFLITALHLLSLSLDISGLQRQSSGEQVICRSNVAEESHPVLVFAGEEIDVDGNAYDARKNQSLLSLLVSLMRIHKDDANSFLEVGNCNMSSLIENILKKFAELDVGCMNILKSLAPEVICHLEPLISNSSKQTSRSTSDAEERKAKARERQAAILEKMRAAQSKFMESLKSTSTDDNSVVESKQAVSSSIDDHVIEMSAPVVCSLCRDPDSEIPVSFLILLQRSRLVSFVDRGPPSWKEAYQLNKEEVVNKNSGSEIAHDEVRSEVDTSRDPFKPRLPATRGIQLPSGSQNMNLNPRNSNEMIEDDIYQCVWRDTHRTLQHPNDLEDDQCLSTSYVGEGPTGSLSEESLLLGEYIASLSSGTSEQPTVSINFHRETFSKNHAQFASFDGLHPTDCDGIHISSCGHAIHQECRDRYLSSLKERYTRRLIFEGGHVVDPDQGEFLCPVCRRLANSVLPAFPHDSSKFRKHTTLPRTSGISFFHLSRALHLLQKTSNVVAKGGIPKVLSVQRNQRMLPTLEPAFRFLCSMYFGDRHDKFSASGRVSHSMLLWDTLKYSLISTEIAGRHTSAVNSGLGNLYRELETSSGFILSLLLRVVQSTRSENCLQLLLRFRGIQLFARSICSGISVDEFSGGTGNFSSVLRYSDKGTVYPDIQFWKRAADPVLAHDPFSSLMWVLFSLPTPFLSSGESFISLVHLFYFVCVIQALLTCYGKCRLDTLDLGSGNCLADDICKFLGDPRVQRHFVSSYVDSSCSLKDMIRKFSHPYLRRCSLLWKLLNSSISAPFSGRSFGLDKSSFYPRNDVLEGSTGVSLEPKELEELESTFQIPELDSILRDKASRSLSLKWLHHFCEASKFHHCIRSLHLTPAVPFSLMRLPHVYQDLLERYIKPRCPQCKDAMYDHPALCLLCGRLCSQRWKPCCRDIGCHAHAVSCGAGVGVFLLIRKTNILLLRSARQSFWASPYLDVFGEEDIDMQRGKPLYLNEERYAALTYMVASHGLDRSSEVLRQTSIDVPHLLI
ncbi:hypothetical protein Scep_015800 [Stephania cephalantha]|uniref:E3 ubiquitin-protein ligase n=1 Tax=Stephania cephalantha TaxID=152367 RepID=A0AAP0P1T7_9MAGN